MRKLAIDFTFQATGGVLARVNQLIKNINSYDFDEVIFFIASDNRHHFENSHIDKKIILKYVKFSNKSIILRTIWVQILLPILLVLNHIDVLYCPVGISPIINIKKKVQYMHTIGPFERDFISFFNFRQRVILYINKYFMIFSAYTSDRVIFDSKYTRDLFVKKFKQKIEKSSVIHSGNDEFFKSVDSNNSNAFNEIGHKDFILTVSHLYPYKNLEVLIDSFYNLKLHERGLHVLVAGSISNKKYYKKLKILLDQYGISKYVIFLGRIESEDLRELYSQCKIFVYTSPFENFSNTLVEALCCSAPIISTNTTSMPEVCGAAALYFSPDAEEELSECIMTFLSDEKVRLKYKEMALLKSKEYPVYSEQTRQTNILLTKLL
jgi:glycosyltransferase involved in cell wall biosynthesis